MADGKGSGTTAFECRHEILIDASPQAVFDYVTNPRSWPEWIAASHHIDSPDRPLGKGERFNEQWHTRTGGVRLDWIVTACEPPHLWIAETGADFIGPIIVRYDCEPVGQGARYVRTVRNPARPRPATPEIVARVDEEAATALANIKTQVERRSR